MKHTYQATLRVHNGWLYNDPKGYITRIVHIRAHNKEEAFAEAKRIAEEDDQFEVTVRKKDVVRIHEKAEKSPYEVTLEFVYRTTVTVRTTSYENAVDAVREMDIRRIFGRTRRVSVYELEDGQPISVTLPCGRTKHL